MKYLIFSCLCLLTIYAISAISYYVLNRKKEVKFNTQLLSKDIFNVLKGLFIVLIMLAHIGNQFGIRYLNPLGSWGVAVFLFCSGYGLQISYSKGGLKKFWQKRILTAYLPYLLIEIVGYIFLYGKIGVKDIILDLLLISPLHPFGWYMQYIFYLYIAFYVASLIFKKDAIRCTVVFLFALCLFVFARSLFKQQIFTFTFGMLTAIYYKNISKYFSNLWICSVSILLGVSCLATKQLSLVRDSYWAIFYICEALQTFFLMLGAITFVSIISNKVSKYLLKPFELVGIISYEVYLIHAFLMPEKISYISIAVFFVLSILIPAIVYVIKSFIRKQTQKL